MDEEFGDVVRRALGSMGRQVGARAAPVDLLDCGDALRADVALPGRTNDDLAVGLLDPHTLSIRAAAPDLPAAVDDADGDGSEGDAGEDDDGCEVVRRERRGEPVERTVSLPEPVEPGAATATYDAGVLRVTMPKRGPDLGDAGTTIPVE